MDEQLLGKDTNQQTSTVLNLQKPTLFQRKPILFSAIFIVIFVFIGVFLTQLTKASPRTLEVENGILSGQVKITQDQTASSGAYAEFANQVDASFQPEAPYYSTFYYAWYGSDDNEWSYWEDRGHNPPQNWFSNYIPDLDPTRFDPSTELYQTKEDSTLYWQLQKMREAKIEVAISSWWGQNRKEDSAFRKIITDVMNRSDNPYPNLRWSIYYEQEGFGNPSINEIVADINYIKEQYASQPGFLKIDGKPVIFVYGGDESSEMANRWQQVREQTDVYTVLKVYNNYQNDENKANSWHQYAPAVRGGQHGSHSYFVSPGFWKDGDPVRLERNLADFRNEVSKMVEADTTWKLIQTWNEWGEGSSVEPGEQVVQTTNGDAVLASHDDASDHSPPAPFKNKYIDVLNELLPNLEQTGEIASDSIPVPSRVVVASSSDDSDVLAATTTNAPGFTFTAGGDLGADQSDTIASLNEINQQGSAFFLALGDLSYNDIRPESAWCDFIKSKVGSNFPFQLVMGNHEDDDRVDGYIGNFRECLPDRMNSTGVYGAEYYFDYPKDNPLARVVMIGAQNDFEGEKYDYDKGNIHYQWLSDTIDQARAQNIPWVVVGIHKPCLTTGNKGCEIGEDVMDLLHDKKVDLVLNGHDHDYQRTKQLTCADANTYKSVCVADADNEMVKGAGTIWVITGHFGGGGFTAVNPNDSEAGYFASIMGHGGAYDLVNGTSHSSVGRGLTKINITADSLSGEMIVTDREGGSGDFFSDTFVVTRDGATPTDPGDSQPPTAAISNTDDGATVSGSYTVAANASDNKSVSRVDFLVDNVVRWSDSQAPYEFTWQTELYSDGSHTISAQAVDSSGLIGSSSQIEVYVNNQTSNCSQTAPSNASSTLDVSLDGTATYYPWLRLSSAQDGNYSVWVTVDGGCAERFDVDLSANQWTWTNTSSEDQRVSIDLDAGQHMVTISSNMPGLRADSILLTSNDGCVPEEFGTNCENIVDTTSPTVSVISPSDNGAILSDGVVLVASAVDDVSIDRVEFYLNDSLLGEGILTAEGYALAWNTMIYSDGSYSLSAVAHDSSGNTSVASAIDVVIDNIPDESDSGDDTTDPPADSDQGTGDSGSGDPGDSGDGSNTGNDDVPSDTPSDGGGNPLPDGDVSGISTTLTYIASADTTVRADKPDRNYGKRDKLEADGEPQKAFYLKFKPSDIDGRKVVSAKIYLYNTNESSRGGNVRFVPFDNWNENKITWDTAPDADDPFFSLPEVVPANWYEIDVTSIVQKDGVYSFKIDSDYPNGADYASRETEQYPKLILTVQ